MSQNATTKPDNFVKELVKRHVKENMILYTFSELMHYLINTRCFDIKTIIEILLEYKKSITDVVFFNIRNNIKKIANKGFLISTDVHNYIRNNLFSREEIDFKNELDKSLMKIIRERIELNEFHCENNRYHFLLEIDDVYSYEIYEKHRAVSSHTTIPVSCKKQLKEGLWVHDHHLYDSDQGQQQMISDLARYTQLQGLHNYQNIAVAYGVCMELGLPTAKILEGISTFPGLEHRQEYGDLGSEYGHRRCYPDRRSLLSVCQRGQNSVDDAHNERWRTQLRRSFCQRLELR